MKDFSHIIDNIPNTEIKKSKLHGYGLFTNTKIKEGEVLCILDGQYINYDFVKHITKTIEDRKDIKDCIDIKTLEWNQINSNLLLVRNHPTKYRFINHYRVPNLRLLQNPLRVTAIKDIEVGEELLLDYREEDLGDSYLLDHGLTYL